MRAPAGWPRPAHTASPGSPTGRQRPHLPPDVLQCYRAIVASGLHGRHHEHVYGANLGFWADAYLAVGGFPLDGPGEDHGRWRPMAAAGYR